MFPAHFGSLGLGVRLTPCTCRRQDLITPTLCKMKRPLSNVDRLQFRYDFDSFPLPVECSRLPLFILNHADVTPVVHGLMFVSTKSDP